MHTTHIDVLVVGAGLSGIGAGYRLQTECPDRDYLILERREAMGGTWDLFRYPGIRSDSDMFTLGFPWHPWNGRKSIADGPMIRDYIDDTAREFGIAEKIRYGRSVVAASWSSEAAQWSVDVLGPDGPESYTCDFLYLCSGYYDYEAGYTPDFPGVEDFEGPIVHPQFWPEDLDYTDKKVVVIGSGATAVTLIPSMTDRAALVTMLQRSPTWIMPLPAEDKIANLVNRLLPRGPAGWLIRMKNAGVSLGFFHFCRAFPRAAAKILRTIVGRQLPPGVPLDPHFTPHYNPWEQRLCVVPDADLFKALRAGTADVKTDHIDTFTPHGIRLRSGEELEADVVVTATGLKLLTGGGIDLTVDGEPVDVSERYVYRGLMLSGVPNLALCIGYTNASWTLRADLTSRYVCRLLNHLSTQGLASAAPSADEELPEAPLLNLDSGYIKRAAGSLPKQSTQEPWTVKQNWFVDAWDHRRFDVTESMTFTRSRSRVSS